MGKELGTYLRRVRREKKMTIKQLALETDISKSMLTYIETGTRDPGVPLVVRYAVAVGLSDLTDLMAVYVKDQALGAMSDLDEREAQLVTMWMQKQGSHRDVLSVVAGLAPLLQTMESLSVQVHGVCSQVREVLQTKETGDED